MKTSRKGLAFIAGHEGVVTRAYRDVAGVWTIGIGHTAAAGPPRPKAGMVISKAEAHEILARDLPKYERRVEAALGPVRQTVFDAAVSFDFNTGAIHRASWVKAYRTGNMTAARLGLLKWVKAGGRTVTGLVRRREAEARLLFDGDYGGGGSSVGPSDVVRQYQGHLVKLGFLQGPVDGLAGPKTRAAVTAYQRARPTLVVDGIAGPATRASLQRDVEALTLGKTTGLGMAGAISVGIAGTAISEGRTWLLPGIAAVGVVALAIAMGLYRYRGPIRGFLKRWMK